VMVTSYRAFELIKAMVEKGNPNSVTDAAVGALALNTCIKGAFLNVRINASGIIDKSFVNDLLLKGQGILNESEKDLKTIMSFVEGTMNAT
jgi:glutamate formiminotransferase / formiminotetrahydrofolate cyclodeaminase